MIDTHSHIYGPEFEDDITDVVDRAKQVGVEHILLPNINLSTIAPMLQLCERYPGFMSPMMGLHPEDVKEDYAEVLDQMERMLASSANPYVAVGEVGLDFYWDTTFADEQQEAFTRQVEWAIRYNLPLMIHTRAAHRQLVDVIRQYSHHYLTGVFHCFGGTCEEAEELLSFDGFALGIGGVLTFKKSALPEVLTSVPLSRIVLETDAPYLAPVPYRGKRNESSYLVEVVTRLSNIYNVDKKEVEQVTNDNVKRIFRLVK